jgi:hypothetical protein
MAWFTSSASAPDVQTGKTVQTQRLRFFGLVNKTYVATTTYTNKEIRGMTKAAADSAAATKAATAGVSGVAVDPIGAGGYNTRYTTETGTGWVEET